MNNYFVKTGVKQFFELSCSIPVIDVRSPSEYEKGHIPCALNIPLFSDEERAVVGTIYKQENRIEAVIKGFDIVGPKMATLLKEGIKKAGKNKKLLLHCWRGGNRSESMAWLFSNAGIDCTLLEGGYKAYRNFILSELSKPLKLIVLGGLTGSGKTAILNELSAMGEQVIDLEGLACHKGSAFGALGQKQQPGSEQFANLLYDKLRVLDNSKRIFVEDESHNIGSVSLPQGFFQLMKDAGVIAIMPDIRTRIPRLLNEYGVFSAEQLIESVNKISKKLGGVNTMNAINSIKNSRLEPAIEIILGYYDKAYRYGLKQRPENKVIYFDSHTDNPRVNAMGVKKIAEKKDDEITAF